MLEADLGAGQLKLINVTLKFDNKKKKHAFKTQIIISLHHVPYDVVDCQCVPCTAKPHAALFVCHTGLRLCCCRPASPPESCGAFQRPKGVFVCQAPFEIKRLGILPAGIHDCCRAGCDREWEKQMEVAVR